MQKLRADIHSKRSSLLAPHYMPMKILKIVVFSFVCITGPIALANADGDDKDVKNFSLALKRFFNEESAALSGNQPDSIYAPRIRTSYNNELAGLFTKDLIRQLPTSILEDAYKAANESVFYSFSEKASKDLLIVANELERRNILTKVQQLDVFKALFSVRDIPAATRWHTDHAIAYPAVMPKFIDSSNASNNNVVTEIVVPDTQGEIYRRNIEFRENGYIVAVVHPLCHFSTNAIDQITGDPLLSSMWQGHVKWISPQSRNYDIDVVREWNLQHPNTRMSIAYKASEWGEIDSWETPVFYFIKSGRVVKKITGWPKNGQMENLYDATRMIQH